MSQCPKCGYNLRLWNVSQFCPQCRTNLMYADYEKKFYEDAKKTEMSLANVRVKVEKVRTVLVGGKLQIARLAVIVLPLLALLVPVGGAVFSLPVYTKSVSVGALGFYNAFSDGLFTLLGEVKNAALIGDAAGKLAFAFYALLAAAAAEVLTVVLTVLSFISIKKMAALLCGCSALGILSSAASFVFVAGIKDVGTLVSASKGAGAFVLIAAFAAVFALNLTVARRGIEVVYKEGDPERMEIRRRYRKKLIALEDIPFPIYETEEERAAREESVAKTEKYLEEAEEANVDA